jgi:hypothetical protein
LYFTGIQFIALFSPSDIENCFCDLFIRGEYSLLELRVLMASITFCAKAILANKKDLKRFQRAQKAVFDLNIYQNRVYICHK